MARVFALTGPGDVVNLSLPGKDSPDATLSSPAPVTFKLFILSHMQERRNRAIRYMPD
jgi:hypothetical protein